MKERLEEVYQNTVILSVVKQWVSQLTFPIFCNIVLSFMVGCRFAEKSETFDCSICRFYFFKIL